MKQIRIGSRASKLAQIQAKSIKEGLEKLTDCSVEIVLISTQGDRDKKRRVEELKGEGVFVREVEQALLDGEVDLAVHSLKDMPSRIDEHLCFVDPPKAAAVDDVFVGDSKIKSLEDLNFKRIGTGSARRTALLRTYCPEVEVVPIRGNIETRISKIESENLDGIILAKAGLERANYADRIGFVLDPEKFIPSPCQGILGLEIRREDLELKELLEKISDPQTSLRMAIERSFQKALSASCTSPLGIYTKFLPEGRVTLTACYAEHKEGDLALTERNCSTENASQVAQELAEELKAALEEF